MSRHLTVVIFDVTEYEELLARFFSSRSISTLVDARKRVIADFHDFVAVSNNGGKGEGKTGGAVREVHIRETCASLIPCVE